MTCAHCICATLSDASECVFSVDVLEIFHKRYDIQEIQGYFKTEDEYKKNITVTPRRGGGAPRNPAKGHADADKECAKSLF